MGISKQLTRHACIDPVLGECLVGVVSIVLKRGCITQLNAIIQPVLYTEGLHVTYACEFRACHRNVPNMLHANFANTIVFHSHIDKTPVR